MDQPQSTEVIDHQIEGLERKSLILSRAAAVILLLLSGLGLGLLLTPDLVPGVQLHVAAARAWYGLAALLGLGVLLSLLTFRQGQRWAARRLGLQGELVRRDALEKLLLIDPLTGAFNRRYLDEILVREVSRAERHGSSLTFLKIQVENLEEPAAGADYGKKERVLKAVAGLLRKNLRPTDVVVRFDENHFMVVMSQKASTAPWWRFAGCWRAPTPKIASMRASLVTLSSSVTAWRTIGRDLTCATCSPPPTTASGSIRMGRHLCCGDAGGHGPAPPKSQEASRCNRSRLPARSSCCRVR